MLSELSPSEIFEIIVRYAIYQAYSRLLKPANANDLKKIIKRLAIIDTENEMAKKIKGERQKLTQDIIKLIKELNEQTAKINLPPDELAKAEEVVINMKKAIAAPASIPSSAFKT